MNVQVTEGQFVSFDESLRWPQAKVVCLRVTRRGGLVSSDSTLFERITLGLFLFER